MTISRSTRSMLLALAWLVAAVGLPAAASSPAPSSSALTHTSDDVALRMELVGGFVPYEFHLLRLPVFTLYSDGLVIYQPLPAVDEQATVPLRQVTLDPDQVRELMRLAQDEGGLADARETYDVASIADAATTVFTVNSDRLSKQVAVYALGFEGNDDQEARRAFEGLARALADFDAWLPDDALSEAFDPHAYLAVFAEDDPERPDVVQWPWSDLAPGDLEPLAEAPFLSTAILTPEQAGLIASLSSEGARGTGIAAPGGMIYRLMLRPILPDESGGEARTADA